MDDLQIGQVYVSKHYYKRIIGLTPSDVVYNFYERANYYFLPNKRRKPVDINYVLPVEVKDSRKNFVLEIKTKKIQIVERLFGKEPLLGMPQINPSC